MKKILFAWIGTADITASEQQNEPGPIVQALNNITVDEVILLTNYSNEKWQEYIKWLKTMYSGIILVKPSDFPNPTDYNAVYTHCKQVLAAARKRLGYDCKFIFHLSPGTPVMHAVWVLLGKTGFPADLIQTAKEEEGVKKVDIPFDISAEYLPPLLRKTDSEINNLPQRLSPENPDFDEIVWRSRQMGEALFMAKRIAPRNFPVLIEGETGTGKELLARAIHKASRRADKPFEAINCGAIPENLVESELFGYKKGAFTGAEKDRVGKVATSSGGTLFLDEIGELPLKSQVMLLRVLQEKKVTPVGSNKEVDVDLRVIAATNRTLREEVNQGRFREDLFYRIVVGYIYLPPLREREGDVGLLVDHFLEKINQEEAKEDAVHKYKKVSPSAKNFLLNRHWHGNARELEFTLQRALLWSNGPVIELEDVKKALLPVVSKENMGVLGRPLGGDFDINALCDDIRKHYLERALDQAQGRKVVATQLLGLPNYQTLSGWVKKYGI